MIPLLKSLIYNSIIFSPFAIFYLLLNFLHNEIAHYYTRSRNTSRYRTTSSYPFCYVTSTSTRRMYHRGEIHLLELCLINLIFVLNLIPTVYKTQLPERKNVIKNYPLKKFFKALELKLLQNKNEFKNITYISKVHYSKTTHKP